MFIEKWFILIFQFLKRSYRKEAAKEAARKEEMEELQLSLKELFIQTEQQATHIRELRRRLGDLGKNKWIVNKVD